VGGDMVNVAELVVRGPFLTVSRKPKVRLRT
jgi:hypothetical protein